jgi:hypothetical protein
VDSRLVSDVVSGKNRFGGGIAANLSQMPSVDSPVDNRISKRESLGLPPVEADLGAQSRK